MARVFRRRDREQRAMSGTRAAVELLGAMVVAGALLAAPFIYVAVRASKPSKPALHAVPISSAACPEIRAIQSATTIFLTRWDDPEAAKASWRRSQLQLKDTLARLDASLTRGLPVVPRAVQSRFAIVRGSVRRGASIVTTSRSLVDLRSHGYVEVNAAYSAYGEAVTLVGDACGSLYAYPLTKPDLEGAAMWARLADWVCGPSHAKCAKARR